MSHSPEKLDINIEGMLEKLLGDQELAYLILSHFRTQMSEDMSMMVSHIASSDFDATFERAHALKGAAAIAGAELIYENLVELQKVLREENAEASSSLLNELKLKSESFLLSLHSIKEFTDLYGNEENISS